MNEPGVNESSGANSAEPDADQPTVSPGAQLAAFREERGWTIEQVASQLNLAPRQILAIEHDNYPALPGMPIVRGFIRAYAKLLKVDPTPLLTGLGGETVLAHHPHEATTPRKPLSTPFSETRLPSMMERPGLSSKWVFGGLLMVLIGVAIWAARHDSNIGDISTSISSAAKEASANITSSDAIPAQANPKVEEQSAVAQSAPAEASAPIADMPPATAVPVSPPVQAPSVASGKDALQFKASEDSWIEVRRAGNNAVLLSRIVKAGETENVEVTEPVSVVIGNAAGVVATLRGAPVEIKVNAANNVARLSLK